MRNSKKLYRSRRDKVIGGVAGGLAEYFEVDVVIFRLLFVLLALMGGGGVIGYIILLIVVPMEPYLTPYTETSPGAQPNPANPENAQQPNPGKQDTASNTPSHESDKKSNTGMVAGVILIVLGMVFLANHMVPWFRLHDFWPLLLIVAGIFIIEPNLLNSKK